MRFAVVPRCFPSPAGRIYLSERCHEEFRTKVQSFLEVRRRPTAVEYAVMLALIVVVCLGAIQTVGTNAKTTFTNVSAQL